MHRSKYMAMIAAAAMALTLAGCGSKGDSVVEVTPTPMATPTPTVVAETVTPLPTSTPAPKVIGTKTAQAKFIYLSNNLQSDIRELYLRVSGDDEGDWGKNLISSESTIKSSEQVQMYYGDASSSSASTDSSESDSTGSQSTSAKYDMKLVTSDGNSSEIYSINLGDMEKASLLTDQDSGSVYLRYMSISTKKETDTRGNSEESSDDSSSSDSSSSNSSSSNSSSSSSDSSSSDSSSSSDTGERELGPDDFDTLEAYYMWLYGDDYNPTYRGDSDSDDDSDYDYDDDYSDDDSDYDDGDDYADESDGYDTDY